MRDTGKNRYNRKGRGQTVLETVFMLAFLLFLFFLIAEFARAWYLKNSLNNAVRVAVRAAVVDANLVKVDDKQCPTSSDIANIVCLSPGVSNSVATHVTVTFSDDDGNGGLSSGDTVTVSATADFSTLFPVFFEEEVPGPKPSVFMPDSVSSVASMRYE